MNQLNWRESEASETLMNEKLRYTYVYKYILVVKKKHLKM